MDPIAKIIVNHPTTFLSNPKGPCQTIDRRDGYKVIVLNHTHPNEDHVRAIVLDLLKNPSRKTIEELQRMEEVTRACFRRFTFTASMGPDGTNAVSALEGKDWVLCQLINTACSEVRSRLKSDAMSKRASQKTAGTVSSEPL